MKSLASRLQQLERVVAARPTPPGPPCPKCGREIIIRPRTALDEEYEARVHRQVNVRTLLEVDRLFAEARARLPEDACGDCVLNAVTASEEGMRTIMRFNKEASIGPEEAMARAGGTAAW